MGNLQLKLKSLLQKIYFRLYCIYHFHGIKVVGDPRKIKVCKSTKLNKGCNLNTKYGGYIYIGDKTEIHFGAIIATYGGDIRIGNNCSINPYCVIYGHGGLVISNDVRIATHTVIIPANHNFSDPTKIIAQQGLTKRGITIEEDVWIGAGAKILDGVILKKKSIVAAGATVNRSVGEREIVGGVPAKKIGRR